MVFGLGLFETLGLEMCWPIDLNIVTEGYFGSVLNNYTRDYEFLVDAKTL